MASTPPTELPPVPSAPGQPDPMPTELPSPSPDVDFPDQAPGSDPTQPVGRGMTGDFA